MLASRLLGITVLLPDVVSVILRAILLIFDLKVNLKKKKKDFNLNYPFCNVESEGFDHIFVCTASDYTPKSHRSIKLEVLDTITDIHLLS